MLKKVIEKLKDINAIRVTARQIKRAGKFFVDLKKREYTLLFHSPGTALSRACQPYLPGTAINKKLAAIENNSIEGLALYKDVISYPLHKGKVKDFSGGLVNRATGMLIEDAIHIGDKGEFSQELPDLEDGQLTGTNIPEIRQAVYFGGILFNHFGHFLLESLGRLWAYDVVKDLDPYILFYSDSENCGYLEKNHFIHQVLSGFNIPLKKVLFLHKTTNVKMVLIPAQKYGYRLRNDPDATFLQFIHGFRFSPHVPSGFINAKKIYVSRSGIPIGRVIGENLFEDYLRTEGYMVLHPEAHNIYEQLAIYNNAGKIIFCDGAAVHTCVLLPAIKADIAVIARRRDRRWSSRNIIDQFTGYKKEVLWVDGIVDQYQFGLESWHALSVVDWHRVSVLLQKEHFVSSLCQVMHETDFPALIRAELQRYIANISGWPEYTEFMITLKEPIPASS